MDKMQDTINQFMGKYSNVDEGRSSDSRPPWGNPKFPDALAEYIAGQCGPTVDELLEALLELKKQNGEVWYIKHFCSGAGAVHDNSARPVVSWPASDTPSKTMIAAIKAAMKPEPTTVERFEKVVKFLTQFVVSNGDELNEHIEAVRKALEEGK